MKKSNCKHFAIMCCLFVAFVIYTILVKVIDVKAIGPENTSVGFSAMNAAFKKLVGFNENFYKISEIAGYAIFIFVAAFGILGIYQLIKRKSLFKVDGDILSLGIFYASMLAFYVLFEHVIINYRPVILDEGLEASFPSSHTMLALCVGITAMMEVRVYVKNRLCMNCLRVLACVLTAVVFFGRTFSGAHWISDIIGGVLLSIALIYEFITLKELMKKKSK